ncbi:sulfurtransferase [Solibacillus sp. R5-41]|uniref:sulfurtransferase n=1 Tax=Solibacillus sp. R5-41 TaxID=2048654 RepID=UPI000C1256C4|nr:sulfurtransferase [Solibacillus sp. R5-41]ATP39693.1 sulfurtransferase [Solibacillus sp. R5-41]
MTNVFVDAFKLERDGRFIDTRYDLQNVDLGKRLFEEEHVKGAIYWDLEHDLSDMSNRDGRHPLPDKAQLQKLFEKNGLQYNDAIYIYDQGGAPYATRAWWMLKYAGFQHVYIVNGGYESLVSAGFEITTEVMEYEPTTLHLQWDDNILLNREDVLAVTEGKHKATLLDARAAGRYRGEFEPFEPIAGHIPTAKNYDWEQLKDGNKLVITSSLLNTVAKEEEIIVYCGSGVTATPVYCILAEAGFQNIKIYMAGYSDWVYHYPVEIGENN